MEEYDEYWWKSNTKPSSNNVQISQSVNSTCLKTYFGHKRLPYSKQKSKSKKPPSPVFTVTSCLIKPAGREPRPFAPPPRRRWAAVLRRLLGEYADREDSSCRRRTATKEKQRPAGEILWPLTSIQLKPTPTCRFSCVNTVWHNIKSA